MKKWWLTIKTKFITALLVLVCAPLGAQTNLLYDGDFEDSQFECTEEYSQAGVNNISNNWFSGIGLVSGNSKFFGVWSPNCPLTTTMNFWDSTYPPYQGQFSGWIYRRVLTNLNGSYIANSVSLCNSTFQLNDGISYFVTLIARRDNTRGNPLHNYSFFEIIFSSNNKIKTINSNILEYSPKDTTHQSFYFRKDTIDFERGFVKLDTCIILNKNYNSICLRFDEKEIEPELISLIHQTMLPINRDIAYWIDEVKIFDALEVEGNPCKLENHPENVSKFELPNIFTPNNEGINDFFVPIKAENIEIEKVVIQNRWGQTVFESNEVNWDGNFQGNPTPDGTYFYIVTYKDRNEKMKSKSGTITLKR
jgi:gliding motility-associated-like protein